MAQQDARSESRRESDPLVDVDVHHAWGDESDLTPYLPPQYQDRWEMYGVPGGHKPYANNGGQLAVMADVAEAYDDMAYSAPREPVREELLDSIGVDVAHLTGMLVYGASSATDKRYANAVCRAFNDYTVDEWLDHDDRFRYSLAVNHQDPQWTAEEIRRLGDHPQVVSVMLPTGATRAFGDSMYDPIYEAATEQDLAVAMHFGNNCSTMHGYPPTAAGWPNDYVEFRLLRRCMYQAHLGSFVFQGTFEKFPDLRVLMLESGWAWVPSFLWLMVSEWKAFRSDVPWVERNPKEYVKDHVTFSTQPVEEPTEPGALDDIIEWMDGEQTLAFASDFPHFDFDHPDRTLAHLDDETRRRITSQNALEALNISP
ncbi:amidohydrolase family protein [Haloarculaceae archaeon H-GB2-1]|nr:amidohydrolase family protein [Haloarculaceae archaeon H-GB1-1]MEA5387927.1 amidohydrolase family protein [Haloarculaceae archaeon H-GB11]MEA5409421.1 amidohydrolase family protein [Haloarculaceae archaeon H-GB2-1]